MVVYLIAVPVRVVDEVCGGTRPGHRADVRKALRLDQAVGYVDSETIDPEFKPEAHRLLELCPHLWIAPVDVRLTGGEQVQVPLT